MNYCKKCGQQAAPGAVCCTNCGEKLENTENAARNTAYPQVKPKSDIKAIAVIWFAVGGLILLLCFIGGCMLLGGAGDMAHIKPRRRSCSVGCRTFRRRIICQSRS